MYKHVDYFDTYGRIMQFNKNKKEPFHRWYPFVEGYSKEFIQSIIGEMGKKSIVCLDPFSGSGTTALELQNNNIPCFAFEVNPLMYLIARVKLEKNYDIERLDYWYDYVIKERTKKSIKLCSNFSTLYQGEEKKKWNYNTDVAIAVEKLNQTVDSITEEVYRELFKVALASILLDVSNLYRNGKCLSYKKEWNTRVITEEYVFEKFDRKIKNELRIDIVNSLIDSTENNKNRLFNMDSREGIEEKIEDNTIDLVITSPPYLNSRDYTDTYMLELKSLGFAKSTQEIRKIREKTLRSHVQIKWDDSESLENELFQKTIKSLERAADVEGKWNASILDMVRLYFVDMRKIFRVLYKKMNEEGRIYFNVSNSAYFKVMIDTLDICASIAEEEGFKVMEIRDARYLKPSPQQQSEIEGLLEGVIVLEKRKGFIDE